MDSDLVQQLNAFSVSTPEEKLSNRLTSTHLQSRPAQAFFGGTTTTTTTAATNNNSNSKAPQPMSASPSWLTEEDNKKQEEDQEDEGWGDLPSIHSGISQDYQFGFNSILSSNYAPEPKRSVAPNSAFARFKHAPVSFTNASSPPIFGQDNPQ
ncbi:hypothetical protein O0I10_000742 [Lichtheimia ornata]|uniref:Uncharacterized protein n=1 Tax=Lichtheimia ornata TaxID=688661 RepID=A0AAD7Y4A1_9FUNG|nr:uncharacterized protein O0I10_000742 [Lichtheimia ornata]KAJ8663500.1 hypothetical protein O0I10_000742 [Lichtheimia ornata]